MLHPPSSAMLHPVEGEASSVHDSKRKVTLWSKLHESQSLDQIQGH